MRAWILAAASVCVCALVCLGSDGAQAQDESVIGGDELRLQGTPRLPRIGGNAVACIDNEEINHFDSDLHMFEFLTVPDGQRRRVFVRTDRVAVYEGQVMGGSRAADSIYQTEIEALRAAAGSNSTVELSWSDDRTLQRIIVRWRDRCPLP